MGCCAGRATRGRGSVPRRKPASARANRETRDIGLVRLVEHGVPECPTLDGLPLLAGTQSAWELFWRSDVAGLVVDADRPALRRLFEYYDLRERMLSAFLAEPFTTGSTGQTVAHPASKEVASLEARIQALEDRFGITPAGRLKLGIVLGAAAKSLEDMNASFLNQGHDQVNERDPRVRAVDTTAV